MGEGGAAIVKQNGFALVRPCKRCPFRVDVPGYLRRGRAVEIARSLGDGAIFSCHETTVDGEDDDGGETLVAGPESQFCAGALIVLERGQQPNQAMRMAERLGLYDRSRLDMKSPVVRSLFDFVDHHADAEDREPETCHVAEYGCEAPAGYLVGGVAVPPEESGDVHYCPNCGEPTCDACSNDEGVCSYCAEE